MQVFFRYNWIVREQWYEWCEKIPEEELLKERTGGIGSILQTLFHIIDVEWSWIRLLEGKTDFQEDFSEYNTLEKVKALDAHFRKDVEVFVDAWDASMETRALIDENKGDIDAWGEVMRHVIAHEIHHIGQLSIWAREIGEKPVSANLVGKDLIKPDSR